MSFLLVPGAGGDPAYWRFVVSLLEARGQTAHAVRLPAGDESAGLAEYADAIAAAGASLTGVTLVAQSMGGFSAPLACDRLDVREIVLVNAMVPTPGETAGAWWGNTGQAEARRTRAAADGRQLGEEFDVVSEFLHDVPSEIAAELMSRPEDAVQGDRPFGEPWPLAAWPALPTRGVAGRDDRFFPADFQQRVARERLGLELDGLPGGHLIALARPTELTDWLVG